MMTLHVDVGRVNMAGRYAEIGKTVSPVCSKFATSQLIRKMGDGNTFFESAVT